MMPVKADWRFRSVILSPPRFSADEGSLQFPLESVTPEKLLRCFAALSMTALIYFRKGT
jgi:hypothetical protein